MLGYSVIDLKVCQETGDGRRKPKDSMRKSRLYDNLKPLVGKCLQYLKELTNKVDKNSVAVTRTSSHCKEEVVGATEISMIVSMFLSLPHCALDIFATGKRVKHGGEYRLEIPADFHLYVPEKAIKLAKK